MKIGGSFVTDLSLVFSLLQEHFILFDTQFDLREKKNKDTKRVEEYILKLKYKGKDVKLEITGNGFVYAHIAGKAKKCIHLEKYFEGLREENIQEFLSYLQSDNEYELGRQCAGLNKAQFAT